MFNRRHQIVLVVNYFYNFNVFHNLKQFNLWTIWIVLQHPPLKPDDLKQYSVPDLRFYVGEGSVCRINLENNTQHKATKKYWHINICPTIKDNSYSSEREKLCVTGIQGRFKEIAFQNTTTLLYLQRQHPLKFRLITQCHALCSLTPHRSV
jgi:hypothetical protein